ncbi:hypothetical protein SAMN04487894_10788 [Niabella drilacis]|uniref:Uncharacterized protein n=1 Tax=Niabella drilacis (strain DSM 25811 / CCM 8410 / CCUG 62505 / LMG 26954 / E90) TaxID=1285928 RepID=A0A1G6T4Q4_NIADE|nr:hypothetical protein SAMN04487894_10788 [Niabella drilacis]
MRYKKWLSCLGQPFLFGSSQLAVFSDQLSVYLKQHSIKFNNVQPHQTDLALNFKQTQAFSAPCVRI